MRREKKGSEYIKVKNSRFRKEDILICSPFSQSTPEGEITSYSIEFDIRGLSDKFIMKYKTNQRKEFLKQVTELDKELEVIDLNQEDSTYF